MLSASMTLNILGFKFSGLIKSCSQCCDAELKAKVRGERLLVATLLFILALLDEDVPDISTCWRIDF